MDAVLAIVVAVLIACMGAGLILKSSRQLLDRSCIEEAEKLREVLARHKPQFMDYHKVKTRRHGNQVYAELHLTVDGSLSVKEAHDLTDHLKDELKQELPLMDLAIHIEPEK